MENVEYCWNRKWHHNFSRDLILNEDDFFWSGGCALKKGREIRGEGLRDKDKVYCGDFTKRKICEQNLCETSLI